MFIIMEDGFIDHDIVENIEKAIVFDHDNAHIFF